MKKIIFTASVMIFSLTVLKAETLTIDVIGLVQGKIMPEEEVVICPETAPILCEINNGCCPTEYPQCGWFNNEVRCYREE